MTKKSMSKAQVILWSCMFEIFIPNCVIYVNLKHSWRIFSLFQLLLLFIFCVASSKSKEKRYELFYSQ